MMMSVTEMERMKEEHILEKTLLDTFKFSVRHQSGDVSRELDTPVSGSGEWL